MRSMTTTMAFLVLVQSALSCGCAGSQAPRRVTRDATLRVQATTSLQTRWTRLLETAQRRGWHVSAVDPFRHRLVALDQSALAERDRIEVALHESANQIAYRTEIHKEGKWYSSGVVCDTYGYARERELLAEIDEGPEEAPAPMAMAMSK